MTTFYTHSHLIFTRQIHEDDIRIISITNELTAHIYLHDKKEKETRVQEMSVRISHRWHACANCTPHTHGIGTPKTTARQCLYYAQWSLIPEIANRCESQVVFVSWIWHRLRSWQCKCRGPTCVITIVHSHNQTGSPWTCPSPADPINKQNETKISELNKIVWSWKLIQEHGR